MEQYTEKIEASMDDIMNDIQKMVLEKYDLGNLYVASISFSTDDGCPRGYRRVCQYLGFDPNTGRPITICNCVPGED